MVPLSNNDELEAVEEYQLVDEKVDADILDSEIIEIPVEQLPATFAFDSYDLIEIKEPGVLAEIMKVAPNVLSVAQMGAEAKANTEVLYKAILPAGKALTKAKGHVSAYRGFYKGANGAIEGHATFKKVVSSKSVARGAGGAASLAFQLAIQATLKEITKKLDQSLEASNKILSFENAEYRGKVEGLLLAINKITSFQEEIIANDEIREREAAKLESLDLSCCELLGQAIKMCSDVTNTNYDRFNKFMDKVKTLVPWINYQQLLAQVLSNISQLRYALNKGNASIEYCSHSFNNYIKKVDACNEVVLSWLDKEKQMLGIDLAQKTRKRDGLLGTITGFAQKKLSKDIEHIAIEEDMICLINSVSSSASQKNQSTIKDIFSENMEVIAKDGKIYYLSKK